MYYMPGSLTKEQEEVWDRLNYVPPATSKPWAYSASHTAPHNALPGSIYFDTTVQHMMLYDGKKWKRVV